MEKFSLEKYLETPNRKVVTRLKKSVQIISIEGKKDIPIIALVEGIAHQYKPNGHHADVVVAYSNQCRDMGDYDLFFADDEEETEFEKALKEIIEDAQNRDYIEEVSFEFWKAILLDLARKELMSEISDFEIYDKWFKEGKKYALKDLPKWKKYDKNNDNIPYITTNEKNGNILVYKGYYIPISKIETLLKEE